MSREYSMSDFRAEMVRRGVSKGSLAETWPVFVQRLVEGARARLAELADLSPAVVITCPWLRLHLEAGLGGCARDCRCLGTRKVNVFFLLAHYRLVIAMYAPHVERR